MQNFELGPDEACIVADDDRNIEIIGATDKKNHENILADRWVEMYVYYTGVCIYYICYM